MPYESPRDFAAGLMRHDPAARQELCRRYRPTVLSHVNDVVARTGLTDCPNQMADRQLRCIEMYICSAGESRFENLAWPEFDYHVSETSQKFLCTLFDRRFAGKGPSQLKSSSGTGGPVTASPNFPPSKPLRGLCPCGPFSIRWSSVPVDHVSGDFWDFQRRHDGSLVLIVGDVTGHGPPAALLTQGVPLLFHACLSRQKDPIDLTRLQNVMDKELSEVLPLGCFVQAALFHFRNPNGGNTANDLKPDNHNLVGGSLLTITPHTAVASWYDDEEVYRTLAMTAYLLGIDYATFDAPTEACSCLATSLPNRAEIVACTDGVFDQPTDNSAAPVLLRHSLILSLPDLLPALTLFDQVLRQWRDAVHAAGKQADNTLIVSVRRSTPEESLVFKVLEHDPSAQQQFFDQFRRAVWKLVNKFSKPNPQSGADARTSSTQAKKVRQSPGQPDAEDIFQETFWHLFQKLPHWSGGSLYAWVTKSGTNFILSRLRPRRKGVDVQRLGEVEPAGPSSDDPGVKVAVDECFERLLRELDPEQRRLLDMVLARQALEQILTTLRIKRRTYFNRMKQIREMLKKCLEDD
jgi:RNA polymerase sigma factor (sigma-70 family)